MHIHFNQLPQKHIMETVLSDTQKLFLETNKCKIPLFQIGPSECDGLIVRVYDGDTVHAVVSGYNPISGEPQLHKFRIRLMHYNAAEIKGASIEEKFKAQEAKKYLSDLCLGKIVKLRFGKMDLYGRPLTEMYLYPDNQAVHTLMITGGYGKPYEGSGAKDW